MSRRCTHRPGAWVVLLMLAAGCLVMPSPAAAFKPQTHIWIAQQVLNDLKTCRVDVAGVQQPCLTITLTDPVTHQVVKTIKLKVDPGLAASVTLNPDAFRAGSIGPDAYPDLVGGQMTTHPGINGKWLTDDWLRWLVTRASPARQLFGHWVGSAEQAFAFGYLTHSAADVFAHSYINTYAGNAFLLFDGEQDAELRHIMLEDFIRNHTPQLRDDAGAFVGEPYNVIDAPASFLRKNLILNSDVAEQYRTSPATAHLVAMYNYWNNVNAVINKVNESVGRLNGKISEIESWIDSVKHKRVCTPRVCVWGHCTPSACFNLWPAYCFLDPGTCILIEATEYTVLEPLRLAAETTRLSITVPLEELRTSVESAIDAYINTSGEVVKEMMKPAGDPVGKVSQWAACWTPAFLGVNASVVRAGCGVGTAVTDIIGKVTDVCGTLDGLGRVGNVLSWGTGLAPMCEVQAVIQDELKSVGTELLGMTGNETFTSLVNLATAHASAEAVDAQYTASTIQPLLKVPGMAGRATADMRVADGVFDKDAFAAAFDAVQLAKLALLGPAELNRLVSDEGITDTIYGPELYPEGANVLFRAVRSIDGNQQWQEAPIPYPREAPNPAQPPDSAFANVPFGYAFANGTAGFRLWQDCEVRDVVFNKLFKGPLVNIDDLLPENDPNRTNPNDPFPLASLSVLPTKLVGLTDFRSTHLCGAEPPRGFEFVPRGELGDNLPNLRLPRLPDTTPPTLTVPPMVVAECRANAATVADLGDPIVSDARDPNPSVTNDAPTLPAGFPYGDTTVTWTATDASNNHAYGYQTVRVADTTAPSFDPVPQPVTFTANDPAGTIVTLTPPTATDSCGGTVAVALAQPLTALWIGSHIVKWRATDRAGNVAEIGQTVIVNRLPGDVDVDADVDNDDLDIIVAALGQVPEPSDPRDINRDGRIDLADVRALFPLCTPSACHYDVCALYDSTKAAKSGSTIPLKFQICGAAGANLSGADVVASAIRIQFVSAATTGEVVDAGNANADSNFRFDPALGGTGGYIFNLKTTGLAAGSYKLLFTLTADPTVHDLPFVVR